MYSRARPLMVMGLPSVGYTSRWRHCGEIAGERDV